MPNPLAYLMLIAWPVVTVVLFRRLPPDRAVVSALLAAYLILPPPPAVFDFPLMPPLEKYTISALAAFATALATHGMKGSLLPRSITGKLLVLSFILSPIATVLTNPEPVVFGRIGLPGLGLKDAIALSVQQLLLILPFLLARQYLSTGPSQRLILRTLMFGGLAYSLLMLIEIRLSPQLNFWIYGYYQHQFGQSIRFGGFRPVVFLYHGLWVAFFAMTALISAAALLRIEPKESRFFYLLATGWLAVVLVLAKSLGALIFAVLLLPMVLILSRGLQIRAAVLIGLFAVAYPVLKGADLVPQDRLLAAAARIDAERAYSLEFRFDNENTLLERAYVKPVFGWGSWGRNHILDPNTGAILTVTDGRWIILIGTYGWVGFLAEFGLLVLPLLLLWREVVAKRAGEITPHVAPLSLLLAINILDMIPNATLTPLTWLVAGALVGYAEVLKAERLRERPPRSFHWQSIM